MSRPARAPAMAPAGVAAQPDLQAVLRAAARLAYGSDSSVKYNLANHIIGSWARPGDPSLAPLVPLDAAAAAAGVPAPVLLMILRSDPCFRVVRASAGGYGVYVGLEAGQLLQAGRRSSGGDAMPEELPPAAGCVEQRHPVRPGRPLCYNWGAFGVCSFNRMCVFNHDPAARGAPNQQPNQQQQQQQPTWQQQALQGQGGPQTWQQQALQGAPQTWQQQRQLQRQPTKQQQPTWQQQQQLQHQYQQHQYQQQQQPQIWQQQQQHQGPQPFQQQPCQQQPCQQQPCQQQQQAQQPAQHQVGQAPPFWPQQPQHLPQLQQPQLLQRPPPQVVQPQPTQPPAEPQARQPSPAGQPQQQQQQAPSPQPRQSPQPGQQRPPAPSPQPCQSPQPGQQQQQQHAGRYHDFPPAGFNEEGYPLFVGGAPNCRFFMGGGRCDFGSRCKMNHPRNALHPACLATGVMPRKFPAGSSAPYARLVNQLQRLWDYDSCVEAQLKVWLARHLMARENPGCAMFSESAARAAAEGEGPAAGRATDSKPLGAYSCTLAEAEQVLLLLWKAAPSEEAKQPMPYAQRVPQLLRGDQYLQATDADGVELQLPATNAGGSPGAAAAAAAPPEGAAVRLLVPKVKELLNF